MDPSRSSGSSSNSPTPVSGVMASVGNLFGQFTASLWQKAVWFSVAYFVCAEASNYLSPHSIPFKIFWLPAGLYVAVLLLNETRTWPWLVLAAMPANLVFDLSQGKQLAVVFLFFGANTVQAVTGAWLMRRFVTERPNLSTEKELCGIIIFLALGSSMLGAGIGATTLVTSGLSHSFRQSWLTWWLDSLSAIMVVTPLILAWFSSPDDYHQRFLNRRKKVLEAALLVVAALATCGYFLIFSNGIMSPNKSPVLIVLMWAGLRFGTRGATATGLLVSLTFLFFTTQYFTGLTPDQISSGSYVVPLQVAWVMSSMVGLFPAMVLRQRDDKMEELRRSEEKYRKIFENVQDVFYQVDNHGTIVEISPSIKRYTGQSREDHLGKPVAEFYYDPKDRDSFLKNLREKGEVVDHELRLKTKTGRLVYASANARVLMDAEGKPTGIEGSLRDTTEHRQAEESLRESEARLRAMFEASRDAIGVAKKGIHLYANPAYLKLFGFDTNEEIVGTSILDSIAPSRRQQMQEMAQRRAAGDPVPTFYEQRAIKTDGTEFDAEFNVSTYTLKGEIYSLAVIRDITERKRAEAELHRHQDHLEELVKERTAELQLSRDKTEAAYQKLRELEKLRDDLVHMVVHDMRSPLAGLGMFLDSLSPEDVNEADFTETVRLMREASHALSGMVTSLLDVSRLEAGQMPLHCEASDLGQLAIAAQQGLSGLIQGRQISVRRPVSPVLAHCDPIITGRIFQNLLGNALKFTPLEGFIRIELMSEGQWARFSITDTGPGIPVEYHEKVFHKFGQVELRKNRKVPSSGLGLSFCKLAVEAQGGHIQLESELGHGSTFHVRLPGHHSGTSVGNVP